MVEVGVIHGRFQVLHNDHLKYILAGKARCEFLVVGITNPDPTLTRSDPADPMRSAPAANPLTYYERCIMVREALVAAGASPTEFVATPFPINVPELYRWYVPMDATYYLTIYDAWGRRKLAMFQTMGLKTEVLWERPAAEKGLTATEIRRKMARGEPWEELTPEPAAALLKKWGVPERLRKLGAS